jgi:hypothetical protein
MSTALFSYHLIPAISLELLFRLKPLPEFMFFRSLLFKIEKTLRLCDLLAQLNKVQGIHGRVVDAQPEMQMRPGGPAGGAHPTDHIAFGNHLPGFNSNPVHMKIHALDVVAMIDDHRIAREKMIGTQNDLAAIDGQNRRAYIAAQIHAGMG